MRSPSRQLSEEDVDRDPFRQFHVWFQEAASARVRSPEAAALATATPAGMPSVRMVLVKQIGEAGFVFYSNYESRKGRELAANPRGALLFHWELPTGGRQVRIEGGIERLSPRESAVYVRSRARGSQLSALASPQSHLIESRAELERRVAELAARYDGAELPLSDVWGGFCMIAASLELWQQRDDRLHDRLRYVREAGGGWRLERLAP